MRRQPVSHRRPSAGTKSSLKPRRLSAELLEDRRLMAASELFPSSNLNDHGHDHSHGHGHGGDSAMVGQSGHVGDRVDIGPVENAPAAISGDPVLAPATMSAELHPLSSIPVLNSFPGAPVTIFLDFNGHSTGSSTTPVYDADGDAATFSDQELQFMVDLWRVTSEDYAPFNINVTTVEPAVLAPGVDASAANGKALRLAIGGTHPEGYAGLAAYNAFTNAQANLAWVYAQGRTDAVSYGTIASHEAGHSFGLRHKNGAIEGQSDGWFAIMRSYSSNTRGIWSTGVDDQGNAQNDMAMIASALNGITYRADDHAGGTAAATPLAGSGTSFAGAGVISSTSDVDVFSLPATGSSVRISIAGDSPSQNLDAALELLDASGNLLARSAPDDSANASLFADTTGPAYLAVRSSGQYGRIGQYMITVEASGPGVTVTGSKGPFTTSESGRSTSQTLVLNARPTADVVFNVASSDDTEGALSTTSIVFTPDNWFIPRTVTVTGVADGVTDGAAGYAVTFAPAESIDPSYGGFDPADLSVVNLDDALGQVYWIRSNLVADLGVVERSTLAGDAVQTVLDVYDALGPAPGNYSPNRLTLDAISGTMYWTDSSNKTISRANVDGSGAQVVLTLANNAIDVAIDAVGGKIYWTDGVLDKILRANLDGSGVEDVIASGLTAPSGLELDLVAGKLYWSDGTTYAISRANLDGSGVEVVRAGDGLNLPQSITLDVPSGKMYYGLRQQSFQTQQLYRANLDGSAEEMLVDLNAVDPSTPNPVIQGIAVDHAGGRIVWSQSLGKRVYSADLDGGNVAVIFEGTTDLRGIAFLPATPGFTVTPTSGLATTEAGGAVSFTVVLNAPPTADVVIPLGSSDVTEGIVSSSSLTFTPADWNIPQTVTVTGVDDSIFDQDVTYSIVLGAAASADPQYSGLDPADVAVVNRDNDPAPTKFYVVNDATQNGTYEYGPTGTLVESYNLNSGNSAPRGAASSIVGDKTWVVDANRKVFVYNASGGLLGSWTASSLASNATPEGIATNGADVWIVDGRSDKVFRYAGAADRQSGSQTAVSSFRLNSGNTNPKDIVTDGQYLWVVNDASTDKVFKYTVGGTYLGSWTIDSSNRAPTGLTLDPSNPQHIWIVDSGTDRVYQYNSAVGKISGSQAAASSFALAAGNTNPQGIADPPSQVTEETAASRVRLLVFNPLLDLRGIDSARRATRVVREVDRAEASARLAPSQAPALRAFYSEGLSAMIVNDAARPDDRPAASNDSWNEAGVKDLAFGDWGLAWA